MCTDVVISFSNNMISTPESGTLDIDILVETNGNILSAITVQFMVTPSPLARKYHVYGGINLLV